AGAICPQPVSTRCRRLSDFQPPELSDLRPPLTGSSPTVLPKLQWSLGVIAEDSPLARCRRRRYARASMEPRRDRRGFAEWLAAFEARRIVLQWSLGVIAEDSQ